MRIALPELVREMSDIAQPEHAEATWPISIQPHGIMLVVSASSLLITHVAGDLEQRLGVTEWRDQPVETVLGLALAVRVASLAAPASLEGHIGLLQTPGGETLDVTAYVSGSDIIVEIEGGDTWTGAFADQAGPQMPVSQLMQRMAQVVASLERAQGPDQLCERAAIEVRRLSDFDRVIVYRFLHDGTGVVVAEDRRDGVESLLRHHFSSSTVPAPVQALYLRNRLRMIPDTAYFAAPLRPSWMANSPLDMSDSSLRTVSPDFLLYLQGMGVAALASFSIVVDDALWGLVACHNMTPRAIRYDVRACCSAIAGSLGTQLKARADMDIYRQQIRLDRCADGLALVLSGVGALGPAVTRHVDQFSRMMRGDGFAVLQGTRIVRCGVSPDEAGIRALARWLLDQSAREVFSCDNLSGFYAPAADFARTGSGLLAITLSKDEPWLLLWFRVEQTRIVEWAGNADEVPAESEPGVAMPRSTFCRWSETVAGHAEPWSAAEIAAAVRLRASLLEMQHVQLLRELNQQLSLTIIDKDLLLERNRFVLGEVNHRVQNSLSLVSGFLAMQAQESLDPGLHAALEEARRRLSAVALVHRRLHRGDSIKLVDAGHYIEELCADTFAFMGRDWLRHLTLCLSPVKLSSDRAVPLGLVLTELLINANKYAYTGLAGPIRVELAEDRGTVRMIVADNGICRSSERKGFGSRIMHGLVRQLGGTVTETDNLPGLRIDIVMPMDIVSTPIP